MRLDESINYSRVRAAMLMALVVVLHFLATRQVVVADVVPDLLMLVSVTAGALLGLRTGALVAFIAGVCADLLTTSAFGASALAYIAAAILANLLARNVSRAPAMQMLVAFIGSFFGTVVLAVVVTLSGTSGPSVLRVVWVAAVVGVINAFLAPVASKLLAPDSDAARQLTFARPHSGSRFGGIEGFGGAGR